MNYFEFDTLGMIKGFKLRLIMQFRRIFLCFTLTTENSIEAYKLMMDNKIRMYLKLGNDQ